MNNITIEGHLGKEAKLGFTKKGNAYAHFSVADSAKEKDGASSTIWWNCSCWDIQTETADKLRKGARVKVEGWVKQEAWLDKATGTERKGLKVNVQSVTILLEGKKSDVPEF